VGFFSPVDLAILLGLAGSEVQEMAGEILGQNVFAGGRAGRLRCPFGALQDGLECAGRGWFPVLI
jgi:hypothetical protein